MAYESPDDPVAAREQWNDLVKRNNQEQRILCYMFLLVAYFIYWLAKGASS